MDPMSIEEIDARVTEIRSRLTELDTEYRGQVLPDDQRAEWNTLNEEKDNLDELREELEARSQRVAELAGSESHQERGASFHTSRPGVVKGDDIYDLTTIRSSFTDPEAATRELHDRAKRSLENATFADDRVSREDAQAHVERLLATRDSKDGDLGRLILQTGSPTYMRTFRKYLAGTPLSSDEQRAFALTTTGLPVPYTLDPTVVPVSNSVVNPLRAISSVEQIVGTNEWRGLTAAAITASRASEGAEATDNTPTLAQPTITASKVHAFVPFSIESGQDWGGMAPTIASLLADAKDDEEATAFATGDGNAPNPFGVITGATNTTDADSGLSISRAALTRLEGALAPRFRPRAQFIANRAMYSIIRGLDTAGGSDLWVRIGDGLQNSPASIGGNGNTGHTVLGYPANELSTMTGTVTNGAKVMVLGDFSYFKIIDRVGMSIEVIPHLFGGIANYPTGQRGFYAHWRNGSKVLSASAFRTLLGKT